MGYKEREKVAVGEREREWDIKKREGRSERERAISKK